MCAQRFGIWTEISQGAETCDQEPMEYMIHQRQLLQAYQAFPQKGIFLN